MKIFKITLFICALTFLSFTSLHKYYISVTQIEFVKEKHAVQIISRIFIDDLEKLLRERYDESITLVGPDEPEITNTYISKYLNEKFKVKINGKPVSISFIGKEYDSDIAKCYLEILNVKSIESIEISNQVLFDIFPDQQNIIKTKINSKEKSAIQIPEKPTTLLKFN